MSVPLRFLNFRLSSVSNKLRRPILLVRLSSILYRRSIWNIQYQRPILKNVFSCLNTYKRYKRTKKEVILLNTCLKVTISPICFLFLFKNDEDSDDDLDLQIDDSSQLIKFRTSTMRMDAVLKHALGKSRK